MAGLPAWVGWPGTGPAPGHDWMPGPALRSAILLLTYAFLALALTVNYAASVTFFLLAIIGMYVGLRRGFVNGITGPEKWVMFAFAAYPAVAIVSYLVGTQTNVGFRFLGRDLRFLLFVPIYVAIRWCRPKARHIGWALGGAAVGACIVAAVQSGPWPEPMPRGVTGTHITFGDLAILSGFLAATLLFPDYRPWKAKQTSTSAALLLLSVSAIGFGAAAGVLAVARGGWLAVPLLLVFFLWSASVRWKLRRQVRVSLALGAVVLGVLGAWAAPGIRYRIGVAKRDLVTYFAADKASYFTAKCVDRRGFLSVLLRRSTVKGTGRVRVQRLDATDRAQIAAYGCQGRYALFLSNERSSSEILKFALFRGAGLPPENPQAVTILAKGVGELALWWRGPPTQIRDVSVWREYRAEQTYPLIGPAELWVPPGANLWVVPTQGPWGNFAYELTVSSVGQRLRMWHAAWTLFLQHPLLGVGTGSFSQKYKAFLPVAADGRRAGDHQHAHNGYLTALATRGLLGLAALLALLLSPLAAVMHDAQRGHIPRRESAAAVTAVSGISLFALTESVFVHSLVISWYVICISVLVAAVAATLRGGNCERPQREHVAA